MRFLPRAVLAAFLFGAVLSAAARATTPPSGSWSSVSQVPLHRGSVSVASSGGILYVVGGNRAVQEYGGLLAFDPVAGTWTSKAVMATPRNSAFVGVSASSTVFAAGGWTGSARTSLVEAYSISSDSWTAKTSMPIALSDGGFAVVGSKMYVFGGANSSGTCVGNVYAYDMSADSWTALSSMPTARCHAAAVVYNGKIYVAGGSTTGGSSYATLEAYDVSAGTWTSLTSMQTGRISPGAFVSSGMIYAVSGHPTSGSMIATVEAYDPVGNSWSYKASIPTPRTDFGLGVGSNGKAYAFLGQNGRYISATEAYDPVADSWTTAAVSAPGQVRDAAAVALSTAVYLFGGQNAEGSTDQVLAYSLSASTWSDSAAGSSFAWMPMRLYGQNATSFSGQIFLAGGMITSTAPVSNFWEFDWAAGTWTTRASMPTAGGCGAAAAINGKLYVLVSCNGTAGGTAALASYNPATNAWTSLASAPHVHVFPASTVINGKLYVAGGADTAGSPSSTLDVYDPVANSWTTKTSMPTARTAPAGGGLGAGYFGVAGGDSSGTKLGALEVYDSVSDAWTSEPSMTTPRSDAASAMAGTTFYALGGTASSGDSAAVETFALTPQTSLSVASVAPSTAAAGTSLTAAATGTGFDSSAALSLERFGVGSGAWAAAASMSTARLYAGTVLLHDGRVMVAGGYQQPGTTAFNSVEIYDPASGTWSSAASMTTGRMAAVLVTLKDGRVLAAGGRLGTTSSATSTAEIYDPSSDTWTPTGAMPTAVYYAPAVLLSDGRVLVVGGGDASGTQYATSQIFDPASGTWSTVATSVAHSSGGLATLSDGRVLAAGGTTANSVFTAVAEIFNPATNAWTAAASMAAARQFFGLAPLPDGRLIAAGGTAQSGTLNSSEIYDPVGNNWTYGPSLSAARYGDDIAAVGGRVLVIGGQTGSGVTSAVDIYDPAGNIWLAGPSLVTARESETPIQLGDGRVLVAGGYNISNQGVSSAELLTLPVTSIAATGVSASDAQHLSGSLNLSGAATGYWDVVVRESGNRDGRLSAGFQVRTAALTWAPSVASITPSSGTSGTSAAASLVGATFDASAAVSLERYGVGGGSWTAAASMTAARLYAGTVKLNDGRVLVAGGYQQPGTTSYNLVEIYDPASGVWSPAAPMHAGRIAAVFVTLKDGRVLAAGGRLGTSASATPTAELYDPASDAWSAAASMPTAVYYAPAILLSDGRVLVAGGGDASGTQYATSQIFDPASGTWSTVAMSAAHSSGGLATLSDGRVLAAGGTTANSVFTAVAEIFNPATNAWTAAASMAAARQFFGLAPLPDGRLIAAGGTALSGSLSSSEFYDPVANAWTAGPSLSAARYGDDIVAVDGRVMVIGGQTGSGATSAVDVYDPTSNSWTAGPSLITARESETPILLGDGRVLVAGGYNISNQGVSSTELLTMPVTSIAATGVSVADSQHLSGSLNLSGATTGYWDVVVRESGSRAGRLSGGFQILLPSALPPPPFSGSALGTSSISWTWSLVSGATSYHVFDTTGADKSGALSSTTVSWIETGLAVNSRFARDLGDFSQFFSSFSASTAVYTAAAPPTGTAVSSVSATSASLAWSANGNPAATTAAVERSTDAASYSQVFSSAVLSFSDAGLSSCTSYYYRVRNRNGDGIPTSYDAVRTAFTLGTAPFPPGALTAQAENGGFVSLSWLASPTPAITGYHLYVSTGVLSYAAPYATLAAGATGYVTPALSTGTVYRFGLRAYACGIEEANTNVIASATPLTDTSGLSAAIKVPDSGKKVSGNRVTVMAEIISGDSTRVSSVRFQYRSAASTSAAWIDIPAADAQHPNPETTAPYFVHWDVTGLPNASYELRAVAAATDSSVDPAPSTVVIAVDAVNPDTTETVVAGSQQKTETVYSGAQRVVSLADSASGAVAAVTMPGGVVAASTDTLNVQVNPSGAPGPSKNQVSLGQVVQLSLASGQTSLNGTASITMTYQDADDTGIVDGTSVRVDRLVILTYNTATGQWRQESSPVVDKTAKTITATTPHFSLFGLFATASTDLSNVLVYPVPWRPNAGDPNSGKPFSSGDATSGIVFDGVTDNVRLQIFSASGSLVRDVTVSGSGGHVQWDGRSANGHDAASGGYLAVITDLGSGAKLVRKIAIIR